MRQALLRLRLSLIINIDADDYLLTKAAMLALHAGMVMIATAYAACRPILMGIG